MNDLFSLFVLVAPTGVIYWLFAHNIEANYVIEHKSTK